MRKIRETSNLGKINEMGTRFRLDKSYRAERNASKNHNNRVMTMSRLSNKSHLSSRARSHQSRSVKQRLSKSFRQESLRKEHTSIYVPRLNRSEKQKLAIEQKLNSFKKSIAKVQNEDEIAESLKQCKKIFRKRYFELTYFRKEK
jgi:hypothetical protein